MEYLQNIDLYPPLRVGLYEISILCIIFFILCSCGWGVHLIIGNHVDPKNIPMVSTVKHPKWTPRLRHIRSHFRKLYLLQAPALWLMWLELRNDVPTKTSRQTLWIEHDFTDDFLEYNKLLNTPVGFQLENNLTPMNWTGIVTKAVPEASPFFSSPQLAMFILQFILYLTWPIVFFRFKRMGSAVYIAVAMWLSLNYTVKSFWEVNPIASFLMYPYFAWITTTTALSFAFWFVNLKKRLFNGGDESSKIETKPQPERANFADESDDEPESTESSWPKRYFDGKI